MIPLKLYLEKFLNCFMIRIPLFKQNNMSIIFSNINQAISQYFLGKREGITEKLKAVNQIKQAQRKSSKSHGKTDYFKPNKFLINDLIALLGKCFANRIEIVRGGSVAIEALQIDCNTK